MIAMIHGVTQNDTNGAFAVLSVLSDDSKFKKRFAELKAMADEAQKRIDTAGAAEKAANAAANKAAAAQRKVDDTLAEVDGKLHKAAQWELQLAKISEELKLRTKAFDEDQAKKAKEYQDLVNKKEGELYLRVQKIEAKEKDLALLEKLLEDGRKKLQNEKLDASNEIAKRKAAIAEAEKEIADKKRQLAAKIDQFKVLVNS